MYKVDKKMNVCKLTQVIIWKCVIRRKNNYPLIIFLWKEGISKAANEKYINRKGTNSLLTSKQL